MNDLEISYYGPSELLPREREFRVHSRAQLDHLKASIQEYGVPQPVIIDRDKRIVCGAAVVAAAKELGLNRIPTICITQLSKGQLRAYAIAANKIADLGAYDELELAQELRDIRELLGVDDLPELGMDTPELDRLLGLGDENLFDDDVIERDPANPVSKPGDLWQLGAHRLLDGDALSPASYEALMTGERAQFVLSDLPYNLSADTISTTGRHPDFQQGAGELNSAEFTRFLTTAMRLMRDHSANGSIAMVFMSWHFLLELLRAGKIVFSELKTIITWVKPFPGLGSWYRAQTEFVVAFKNGTAPHLNNLGPKGRNRSTAWQYDGLAGFGAEREELLASHPTCKPVPLIADAILDCTDRGGIVLDPFAGSGTLALAAEQTGRVARMIELDSLYVDVALRRFRKATGIDPIHLGSGRSFSELEAEREGDK